ncbi:MAG: hypothetical protein R2787_11340 [Saprospiraceae bacterium]
MSIEHNSETILVSLFKEDQSNGRKVYSGEEVQAITNLLPDEINDAIEILVDRELLKRLTWKGTSPFRFGQIELTSRGRYFVEQITKERGSDDDEVAMRGEDQRISIISQPIAAGSPYGFTDQDWEDTQIRLKNEKTLYVVFGHQFKSSHYTTNTLSNNLNEQLKNAVDRYNRETDSFIELKFISLSAGYGEHLFNQIARDIISSDVAIFETSDLNPNVMIELGVALTWGKRVFPIKYKGQPKSPSDISGQTYADYINDGEFTDDQHEEKLYRMVERAIQKKIT